MVPCRTQELYARLVRLSVPTFDGLSTSSAVHRSSPGNPLVPPVRGRRPSCTTQRRSLIVIELTLVRGNDKDPIRSGRRSQRNTDGSVRLESCSVAPENSLLEY